MVAQSLRLVCLGLPLLVCLAAAHSAAAAGDKSPLPVSIAASQHGMKVAVGDKLFAEYRTNAGGRPVLWPLHGPTGEAMTRSNPVGEALPGEAIDHPHHRGLWFGHESVGGFDFWHDPLPEEAAKQNDRGRQVHRKFIEVEDKDAGATLKAVVDWQSPTGEVIATDRRTFHFAATKEYRSIDFTIVLRGNDRPLVLGDIKDGTFACRVPGAMKVVAGLGGQIVNSTGLRDEQCWGQPAEWVDYSGPASTVANEKTVLGIAMLSHPSNFRPQPRWHVRNYGLFAANPFGERQFPPLEHGKQGAVTLGVGDSLTLRFRVILHQGDETFGRIAEHFQRYAAE